MVRPTEVQDLDRTVTNKALVGGYLDEVFVRGDWSAVEHWGAVTS